MWMKSIECRTSFDVDMECSRGFKKYAVGVDYTVLISQVAI